MTPLDKLKQDWQDVKDFKAKIQAASPSDYGLSDDLLLWPPEALELLDCYLRVKEQGRQAALDP